jgi:hypothetical protein
VIRFPLHKLASNIFLGGSGGLAFICATLTQHAPPEYGSSDDPAQLLDFDADWLSFAASEVGLAVESSLSGFFFFAIPDEFEDIKAFHFAIGEKAVNGGLLVIVNLEDGGQARND